MRKWLKEAGRTIQKEKVTLGLERLEERILLSVEMTVLGGSGSEADPYRIGSLTGLSWVTQHPDQWNASYIQTENIDATATQYWDDVDEDGDGDLYNDPGDETSAGSNEGFRPIGYDISSEWGFQGTKFVGTYNGQGHTIDGLTVRRGSTDYVGLFGNMEYVTIENLGVTDADGTVSQVEFYRDDGDGTFEAGEDAQLGSGADQGGGTWELSGIDPSGWSAGSVTYFARASDGEDWSTPARAAGTVEGRQSGVAVDVELVVVDGPAPFDTSPTLPDSTPEIRQNSTFQAEIRAKNADDSSNGITGGYIDLSFDASLVTAGTLHHGAIYTNLTSGSVNNGAGLVDDMGGTADAGVTDRGDDEWVRLGYVGFTAESAGTLALSASAGRDRFARAGEGAVEWSEIEFNDPAVSVEISGAQLVKSGAVGEATVSFYDIDPQDEVRDPEVAWGADEFTAGTTDVLIVGGQGSSIDRVLIFDGEGGMKDIGVAVADNSSLGALIDTRPAGSDPLAFLASEGEVGMVKAKSGFTGAEIRGLEIEGDWALPADILGDRTAVYSPEGVGRVIARDGLAGDVVTGGDVDLVKVIGGDLAGVLAIPHFSVCRGNARSSSRS
jgi:hypothetical protein